MKPGLESDLEIERGNFEEAQAIVLNEVRIGTDSIDYTCGSIAFYFWQKAIDSLRVSRWVGGW